MLTTTEKNTKRVFDVFLSCIGLILLGWLIILMIIISKIVIGGKGIFTQQRVGQYGKPFKIYKIETIHPKEANLERLKISRLGKWMRHYKIDESPQLCNVLMGSMSFVGPRPDLIGYTDKLKKEAKVILCVKPGITGPASLKFRNEEAILKEQENPKIYNDEVIWPQKVAINIKYVKEYSFVNDIYYILKTVFF